MASSNAVPPKGPRRFWRRFIDVIDHFIATPSSRTEETDRAEVAFAIAHRDEIVGNSLLEAKRARVSKDAYNRRRAQGRGKPELATTHYEDWYAILTPKQIQLLNEAEMREDPSLRQRKPTRLSDKARLSNKADKGPSNRSLPRQTSNKDQAGGFDLGLRPPSVDRRNES